MLWEWISSADEAIAVTDPLPPLLYLVHRLPYPPDKGDRIRNFHLLRALASRAAVHLACLADEPVPEEDLAALRQHCERVAVVPVGRAGRWLRAATSLAVGGTATEAAFASPALRAVVRRWAADTPYRAVLASASSMVPYLGLPELRGIPSVIDLVDVDSQKWLDYAATSRGPRAWVYRTEGRRLRRLEAELPTRARAVTLASEAEAELYRGFAAPGVVAAVTNGVDLDYFAPAPDAPPDTPPACVFVGALDYRPNVDGACWFCTDVWPGVRRRQPRAVLRLVGRQPVPAVRALADRPGVEVVGQVPDVRPYVAAATAVVVPLRLARGVQNKVLEALAMAKAVVASPQALAGFRLRSGAEVLSAAAPAEWIDGLDRLFGDAHLRRDLGSAGRRYVEDHHRWDLCLEPFVELLGLTARHAGATLGNEAVGRGSLT